jgi:hypothetical protein
MNGLLSKVTALVIFCTSRQMGQSLEDRKDDESYAVMAPRRRIFIQTLTVAWRGSTYAAVMKLKIYCRVLQSPGHGFSCKLLISIRYVLCSNP